MRDAPTNRLTRRSVSLIGTYAARRRRERREVDPRLALHNRHMTDGDELARAFLRRATSGDDE